MLKVDNNNNYDYNQVLGKKHMWQRRYIILGLEVWAWHLDQKLSYKVEIRVLIMKSRLKVLLQSLDQVRDLILEGWCRKINRRIISYSLW